MYTHSQMIGGDLDIPQLSGRRACRKKDSTRKLTESTNMGPKGLAEIEVTVWSLNGTDLGSVLVCCNCLGWSSCGTPNIGNGLSATLLLGLGTLFFILGFLGRH